MKLVLQKALQAIVFAPVGGISIPPSENYCSADCIYSFGPCSSGNDMFVEGIDSFLAGSSYDSPS